MRPPGRRRGPAALLELDSTRVERRIATFQHGTDGRHDLLRSISREFVSGYNATLRHQDPAAVLPGADAVADDYFAPFYVEGASTAFGLGRTLTPWRSRSAHRSMLDDLPQFRYLTLVGWGWAHSMLPLAGVHIRRSAIWRTGGLFAGLGIDGIAFATCFLRARPPYFDLDCPFTEPEYEALWLNGYGRALWFVSGASQQIFHRQRERLAPHQRPDLCAGFGLAAAFAGLRELTALPIGPTTDAAEQAAFSQGVAFGLTARNEASPRSYRAAMSGWSSIDADWADSAVEICQRQPDPDPGHRDGGYVQWQRDIRRVLTKQGSPG